MQKIILLMLMSTFSCGAFAFGQERCSDYIEEYNEMVATGEATMGLVISWQQGLSLADYSTKRLHESKTSQGKVLDMYMTYITCKKYQNNGIDMVLSNAISKSVK